MLVRLSFACFAFATIVKGEERSLLSRRLNSIPDILNVGGGHDAQCFSTPRLPPRPTHARQYDGHSMPDLCFADFREEEHIFLIGDYGGVTCGGDLYEGYHSSQEHVCDYSSKTTYVQVARDMFSKDMIERHRYHMPPDSHPQEAVAKQMKQRAPKTRPRYIVSGGDNFYYGGIDTQCGSPMDHVHRRTRDQFNHVFEKMYSGEGLDIPWYSCLGNHDFGGFLFHAAWDQQIAYTWAGNTSGRWLMPALYYHQHVRYPAKNFSIDFYFVNENLQDAKEICGKAWPGVSCEAAGGPTSQYDCPGWFARLWRQQQDWLEHILPKSLADWQIVVSHYPMDYVYGGDYWAYLANKYGIDLYIGSHRHEQELHLRHQHDYRWPHGVSWICIGGGGGINSEWNPDDSWRGRQQYGFMDMTVNKTHIFIEMINERGQIVGSDYTTPRSMAAEQSIAAQEYAEGACDSPCAGPYSVPNVSCRELVKRHVLWSSFEKFRANGMLTGQLNDIGDVIEGVNQECTGSCTCDPALDINVSWAHSLESDLVVCFLLIVLVQCITSIGLSFFYSGLANSNASCTNVLKCSLFYTAMWIAILALWIVIGFLVYGIGPNGQLKFSQPVIGAGFPGLFFAAYQGGFACIAVSIIAGAFAWRLHLVPFLLMVSTWLLAVYAPLCYWIWSGGWLAQIGAWDFGGGAVAHVSAGYATLAILFVSPSSLKRSGHHKGMVLVGTAMLWFGWLGFNGSISLSPGKAFMNTQSSASTGAIMWMLLDLILQRGCSLRGACTGALAGLVAISAGAGFVQPVMAFLVGAFGAATSFFFHRYAQDSQPDYAIDSFCVHGLSGLVGVVLVGVVADPFECTNLQFAPEWCANPGTVSRSVHQVVLQLAAGGFASFYSFIVTCVIVKVIQILAPGSIWKELDIEEVDGSKVFLQTKAGDVEARSYSSPASQGARALRKQEDSESEGSTRDSADSDESNLMSSPFRYFWQ